ncbi:MULTISPECIES: hypothetical protein [Streptomyces]|uniref:Uncharacterized protein n=1 Tax=Streptomyces viridochromogenes TaxID=1938 RepID=A0A0L8LC20_STRVR|nr:MULTISPECIES: hypothetical protein [Streptomyces]KOG35659.1 hypothetical protein ADK34_04925 [Streptomyces viridochromogenes]
MGFMSAWAISSHADETVGGLAPRLLPAMEADRAHPDAARRWRAWQREPLPDHRTWYAPDRENVPVRVDIASIESFRALTAPGRRLDEVCGGTADPSFYALDDVWEGQSDDSMFISVHSKEYAVSSLFHAIGPKRAAQLPGWCGTFLFTSEEVRDSLPLVERALTFTPAERAAAEAQDWLDYDEREESVLDGPLRVWRAAADQGLGLCGVAMHVC